MLDFSFCILAYRFFSLLYSVQKYELPILLIWCKITADTTLFLKFKLISDL